MLPDIPTILCAMEHRHGMRVLFAIESGSRAWGFASQDSDYDVRFVFSWPRDCYLRVHAPPDHLHEDLAGDVDLTGWDLRKALSHLGKSNASFLEWVNSPCEYADTGLRVATRALLPEFFRPKAAVDHYLGLAKQLWLQAGEGSELNGKKFLYVLRSTLAAGWILKTREAPPVPFISLLPLVEVDSLQDEIHLLVAAKQAGKEADAFAVSGELRLFLSTARESFAVQAESLASSTVTDFAALDALFQQWIGCA